MNIEKKRIAILGSTGSIGTQTLDIIKEHSDRFHAVLLTARRNWRLLADQARRFGAEEVVIADKTYYGDLRAELEGSGIKVSAGDDAIAEAVARINCDTVVTAMVGYSGLLPTVEAIKAGRRIALANKETLVVAGELITRMISQSDSEIVPVDSEHSAIFQCLVGENRKSARKIILTASGGPFRNKTIEELREVTVADALHHPNWDMGAKVTIDSASMMNKGFEMIEAKWLFGCRPDQIEIVVHPQSIVHSMVEFEDGSIKAQLGVPDMHIPISYALGYPERLANPRPALALAQYSHLEFEAPDYKRFPLLGFAFDAINRGGNMPCILNAANEVGVAAFLEGRIRFTDIPGIVSETMQNVAFIGDVTLDDLIATNAEAVETAKNIGEKITKQIKIF